MNNFDNEFEDAIRFLTNNMPAAEDLEKPTLFHSLRVGVYLYTNNYSREICIAGLLHDLIEDSEVDEKEIEEDFGREAALLVQANSKNKELENVYEDLISRCIKTGESALIVKAADILDNYNYYIRINNAGGLDYVKMISSILLKEKPDEFKDPIFEELKLIK